MWAIKLSLLLFTRTHSYPVSLLSNWLKLFLRQTLSDMDTPTILKFFVIIYFLAYVDGTERVCRNVGI
jgi:hypothetical protein